MFEKLAAQAPDGLLALIGAFRDDPRPEKIDLGVGVYRDAAGRTPVFAAMKAAERRLFETQDSKAYLGPEGNLLAIATPDRLELEGWNGAAWSSIAALAVPGITWVAPGPSVARLVSMPVCAASLRNLVRNAG